MALVAAVGESTIHIGDTVRVMYRLIEHEKVAGKAKREVKEETHERFQAFEGLVIAIRNRDENQSFVVRRIGTGNIGIERIFPVRSPWIKEVQVVKSATVRRSKLYYLRGKVGKAAEKLKEKVSKDAKSTGKKTAAKKSTPAKTKPAETHEQPVAPVAAQ